MCASYFRFACFNTFPLYILSESLAQAQPKEDLRRGITQRGEGGGGGGGRGGGGGGGGGYSGFQETGMIEGYFLVYNFRSRDYFGLESFFLK